MCAGAGDWSEDPLRGQRLIYGPQGQPLISGPEKLQTHKPNSYESLNRVEVEVEFGWVGVCVGGEGWVMRSGYLGGYWGSHGLATLRVSIMTLPLRASADSAFIISATTWRTRRASKTRQQPPPPLAAVIFVGGGGRGRLAIGDVRAAQEAEAAGGAVRKDNQGAGNGPQRRHGTLTATASVKKCRGSGPTTAANSGGGGGALLRRRHLHVEAVVLGIRLEVAAGCAP